MLAYRRFAAPAVGVLALTLAFSACSGGTNNNAGSANAEITVRGCTPENGLIASNTTEVCGGNVVDVVTARLIHYNADTAAPELDQAESIETSDNQTFTVKLKKDLKFSDGTPLKAKNYVDAWNFAANQANGQSSGSFMEPIEGYADVQCPADDEKCAKSKPKAEKMSGLVVVDDSTFTIKTTQPVSNLKVRLGYTAFAAQPDSFLANPKDEAFGKKPIGAGPFKVTSNDAEKIVLEKNENYTGAYKPHVSKVTYRIYNDASAAYNDLQQGALDFSDLIPADQLVGDAWKKALGERTMIRDGGLIQTVTFSGKDKALTKDVRAAISMSVDREAIAKQIFNGTRKPASGWVSPVVDGYKADACGELCKFNAAKAKELWDKAPYKGKLMLSVNQDGGHKLWADAMCNQINQNLPGAECTVDIKPDFKTLRKQVKARELMGMFRTGWSMDYPSIENFLTPIFAKGSSSNDSDYNNPAFDKLLSDAAKAKDPAEANKLYQQAEALLKDDFPAMPTFYSSTPCGWSEKLDNVKVTPFNYIDLTQVKVK